MIADPYHIWVCLECGKQSRGPGGHSVAGDDSCSGGPGHDPPAQPRLARIPIYIADEGTRSHLSRMRRRTEEREKAWREKNRVEVMPT